LSRLASIGVRPESLDAPLQEDEFTTLGEIVCDEEADDPLELLGEKDSSEQLRTLLKNLNERETTIIAHRFGLNGTSAKPLAQIAAMVGVTRERVRQLEISALAKLRRAFKKQLGVLGPEALLAA
jgi:RNA polymerase sigma factor (sigma-70 family)